LISAWRDPRGLRVTVMGLGLNGGGLPSALFFARNGSRVTVTDLKSESVLRPSLEALEGLDVRLVLGRHEESDFRDADLVIKNPGVRLTSPFLQAAIRAGVSVETDLSVFLRLARNPVVAVTGSKGKSTVASAIHHVIRDRYPRARLGGNITCSPLTFITPPETLEPEAPVVLELSSWQLGDLRGRGLLDPVVAVLTVIFPDHMDAYGGDMDAYVRDKRAIVEEQSSEHSVVLNLDDPNQASFASSTRARPFAFSRASRTADAWLEGERGMLRTPDGAEVVLDGSEPLRGEHNRLNLLTAALASSAFGIDLGTIRRSLRSFRGLEHRLELFLSNNGITYWNDSASTVPDATLAAAESMGGPFILICGGNDKGLDFAPFRRLAPLPERVYLLAGTAAEKALEALRAGGARVDGPLSSLEGALDAALAQARPGMSILFSPGCTSFGMFLNEFDRGRRFKEMARLRVGETGAGGAVNGRGDGAS
jgi:UDP-N-acetylmuramoylalanine--D-glutamate ligase